MKGNSKLVTAGDYIILSWLEKQPLNVLNYYKTKIHNIIEKRLKFKHNQEEIKKEKN